MNRLRGLGWVFAAVAAVAAGAAFADIAIVAPESGDMVSLLKDAQREYLSLPVGVRHGQMADAASRAKFEKCGGRPASVKLEWRDSSFVTDAVYTVELKRVGSDRAERFEVRGVRQVELVNLETGSTYDWKVVRAGGESSKPVSFRTAAEMRLLHVPGVPNCRDLGGRVALGGRRIRQGRVYRTAAYNGSSRRIGDSFLDTRYAPGPVRVTNSGRRELVESLGVKTDLDLRNALECAGMTSSPLGTNVVWAHVPVRAYNWLANDKEAFGRIIRLFADGRNYPIAFHCAGGRDRAGSLAFVLEGLLGVAEDELMKDWEFSMFETADLGFSPSRIDGLVEMLSRYPGDDINSRIVGFVKSCGVTDGEIAAIRSNLLEDK